MRRVVFRDITGQQGSITDELAVNYQGRWEGEIEECLEQIAEDYDSEEMYNHLVVELPDEGPHERLSRVQLLLLVALTVLSVYVAKVIKSSTSVSVLYP